MAIDKDKIYEVVGLFYQNKFKTFYVNSIDGETFVKPIGVFISLGITTSLDALHHIKDVLEKINSPRLDAQIVEIESKKVAGQYMNLVINTEDPSIHEGDNYTISQYSLDDGVVDPKLIMSKSEALDEVKRLETELNEDRLAGFAKRPVYDKLKKLIETVDASENPWVDQKVMKADEDDYRIWHRCVNYRKDPETQSEYRVGIYVELNEKSN